MRPESLVEPQQMQEQTKMNSEPDDRPRLGPSHTAGDIFVYFRKEQVLDAGSILKEQLGKITAADYV